MSWLDVDGENRVCSNDVEGNGLSNFLVNNVRSTFFIMSNLWDISSIDMDMFEASHLK